MVSFPPCDAAAGRPALSEVRFDADVVNRIIDAFSIRNYERRAVSGHDQFFSTFRRFVPAGVGREGHMLAESSARSARQNVIYLELLQSWGMEQARQLAAAGAEFDPGRPLQELARHPDIERLAAETISRLDAIEQQWRTVLDCGQVRADPGCGVTVRYLAQVIRTFPRPQVLAQTLLAYHLIEKDPRYVGLNFVAPEDHPITLRDYRWQMEMIGELAGHFPSAKNGITLHAGEVDLGLVPPEHLGWHIRAALELAGARRIGHGTDILYDPQATQLMQRMAEQGILVEINLTSSEAILGISGDRHPIRAYMKYNVPIALSTDDEGVARIDLTHEYQRAVETCKLTYNDLKYLSRNALAYSFLPGESLLESTRTGKVVDECDYGRAGADDGLEEEKVGACLQFMFRTKRPGCRRNWNAALRNSRPAFRRRNNPRHLRIIFFAKIKQDSVLSCPTKLENDNKTLLATSLDFPEFMTFGDDRDEALTQTVAALEQAIAARIHTVEFKCLPQGYG